MKPAPVIASKNILLEIKTSRSGKETPDAMVQFLSNLINIKKRIYGIFLISMPISLEVTVIDQRIHFYISCLPEYQAFIESQLLAQYPKILISKTKDYMLDLLRNKTNLTIRRLKLTHKFIYPLKTYSDFKDIDPMANIVSILSKAQSDDVAVIQYVLKPVNSRWQQIGRKFVDKKTTDTLGETIANPYKQAIIQKINASGFQTDIRLVVTSGSLFRSTHYLQEIANSFSSFTNSSGNGLKLNLPILSSKNKLSKMVLQRSIARFTQRQILNVLEIATMFHFPTEYLTTIPNISWHKTILSDPPETLPVASKFDEEKKDVNFLAQTEFKNKLTTFGIKTQDRRRHIYIIGKTGSGKSTLIANMAINDMRNRRGFCIIDPHGDLCETILDYVPSYRINDIVYLDPSDQDRAFSLNPLEVQNAVQKELVVSGIVAIFQKLFSYSWGPRLEYILRNALLSIIEMPDATLLMVPELLTNQHFRNKVVAHLKEPVLINYWKYEFEAMPERLRNEAMAPILNKVGQFVQSRIIRNIIKTHESTIDLSRIMNEGKILLLNLSQGRLGEDNAALLGAMIITKIQLAAMSRVNIPESQRKDFYLYVDEFQNFATNSFIKILSEARKYHLNLILANQYIAQVPEEVRAAIFGNAGTILSFLLGATDANYMVREFGERFKEEDLLALGNYQTILKLCVDNITQNPFLAKTLPLPKSVTQNREKVINNSKQRYTKIVKKI